MDSSDSVCQCWQTNFHLTRTAHLKRDCVAGSTWGCHGCDRMAHLLMALVWITHTKMHQVSFSSIKRTCSVHLLQVEGSRCVRKIGTHFRCSLFFHDRNTEKILEPSVNFVHWRYLAAVLCIWACECTHIIVCSIQSILFLHGLGLCTMIHVRVMLSSLLELLNKPMSCTGLWIVAVTFIQDMNCFVAPDGTSFESSTDSIFYLFSLL
jgi:hypothetical protein